MKTNTDSWLICKFKNGDEKALSILIERHQKEIFTYIFYKLMDETLANDIFQDTFMKIIVTLKEGRYKEEGKFVLWAKRIAHTSSTITALKPSTIKFLKPLMKMKNFPFSTLSLCRKKILKSNWLADKFSMT